MSGTINLHPLSAVLRTHRNAKKPPLHIVHRFTSTHPITKITATFYLTMAGIGHPNWNKTIQSTNRKHWTTELNTMCRTQTMIMMFNKYITLHYTVGHCTVPNNTREYRTSHPRSTTITHQWTSRVRLIGASRSADQQPTCSWKLRGQITLKTAPQQ